MNTSRTATTATAAKATYSGSPMMRALAACIQAGVPVLLWGKPGIGKTAKICAMGQAWGRHTEVVVGANSDPTDFKGYPVGELGELTFLPPRWAVALSKAPHGFGFFDELTTSPASVMKAMLRVIQERWVGDLHLPDTVSLVAAANPVDQAVDGIDLPAPIANRFAHLDWSFDRDEWSQGMIGGFGELEVPSLESMLTGGRDDDRMRAANIVVGFTRSAPQHLDPAVPDTLGSPASQTSYAECWAYPSPRSWDNLAKTLTYIHRDDLDAVTLLAHGLVGSGAGREFVTYYQTADLYDPRAVLEGTAKVNWNDRPDRLFALTMSLRTIVLSEPTAQNFTNVLRVFAECVTVRKDIAVPPLTDLLPKMPADVVLPQVIVDELRDVLVTV